MQHAPTDMTVTVAADVTLAALQAELAKSRQWLPLDPPAPEQTLRAILDCNDSGPRRFGYGTVRDYVIGLKVELADGRLIKSGGQVVKNVAGYDLQKLFIGSGGTLGTAREVTFKLRPLPETSSVLRQACLSLAAADTLITATFASPITPVVFDLYRDSDGIFVVLAFEGTRDEVDWQTAQAAQLGFKEPATLDYDKLFRREIGSVKKLSVLPSKLTEAIQKLGAAPFVARAGNGIIFHRAELPAPASTVPTHLFQRVKDTFDPKHRLPELRA